VALSPLLLYQFGWNLHEDLSQTIVLTCAVVAGTLVSIGVGAFVIAPVAY